MPVFRPCFEGHYDNDMVRFCIRSKRLERTVDSPPVVRPEPLHFPLLAKQGDLFVCAIMADCVFRNQIYCQSRIPSSSSLRISPYQLICNHRCAIFHTIEKLISSSDLKKRSVHSFNDCSQSSPQLSNVARTS